MSLKAKLEAVIYAAEEPVTLGQLAIIFADDALAWKAEQETEQAAKAAEEADVVPVNEVFDYADTTAEAAATPVVEPDSTAAAAPEAEAEEAAPADEESEKPAPAPAEPTEASAEQSGINPVAEARRAARRRDKEVKVVLRVLLDEIIATYTSDGHGVEVREIAGGFRMATKPECHDAVRAFIKSQKPALKLSMPALETLAVIAYKQPVTAPEVNEIRGVDSSGVFGSLLARKLIATAGRKPVIGRPILYKTTKEFLLRFGLKDISELPSMEEFEKLAASELEDIEASEPGDASAENSTPEFEENANEEESGDTDAEATAPEAPESKPDPNPAETAPSSAD